MRTTIELREDHRVLLHAIAAERGWRGFSRVVEEAIDLYLDQHAAAGAARRALQGRKGAWSEEESKRMREALHELRARWLQEPA
jgi:hypothetical protein